MEFPGHRKGLETKPLRDFPLSLLLPIADFL
jgi:hypothetical protein